MSGISKNKKPKFFVSNRTKKKIKISFLFNVFKIKKKLFLFKNFEICMKDPESAEMKEKSNFEFWNYYFFGVIIVFVLKMNPIFDEFPPIAWKIKIVEFFIIFSTYSTHSTSFIKFLKCWPLLSRGGGPAYP